ncbi:MAG: hypothetical protein P1U53_13575, partial [Sulfitobacter sp.]|nr:hypothetical protein [Sulfitobacter sp.]
GILLGLVQLLIMIPLGFAMTALVALGGGGQILLVLLTLASGVILLAIGLRLSLILPAAAVETRMTLPDSWEATKPLSRTIWSLALLLTAINLAVSALTALLPEPDLIGFTIGAVIFILEGLVLVSVLTTLFGHLVEGRPLHSR